MSTTTAKSRSKKVQVVVSDSVFQETILKNEKIGAMLQTKVDEINAKIASASNNRILMATDLKVGKNRLRIMSKSTTKGARFIEAHYGWVLKILVAAGMRIKEEKG